MNTDCPKCSLTELYRDQVDRSVADCIAAIPAEQRTDEETYQKRRAACIACRSYQNGLCEECGGYAEVRMAKAKMRCPLNRW